MAGWSPRVSPNHTKAVQPAKLEELLEVQVHLGGFGQGFVLAGNVLGNEGTFQRPPPGDGRRRALREKAKGPMVSMHITNRGIALRWLDLADAPTQALKQGTASDRRKRSHGWEEERLAFVGS